MIDDEVESRHHHTNERSQKYLLSNNDSVTYLPVDVNFTTEDDAQSVDENEKESIAYQTQMLK